VQNASSLKRLIHLPDEPAGVHLTKEQIMSEQILKYEESVKAGSYLLVAHGSAEEVAQAQKLLQGTGASEVNVHTADALEAVAGRR